MQREAAQRDFTVWRVLIPASIFGSGMAASFAAGWLALGRTFAGQIPMAAAFIGVAASGACLIALLVVRRLGRRPGSARFAAAFLVLSCGTVGIASLFLAVERAWTSHPLTELPLRIAVLILAINGAGSLYGFLSIAAWLMLPLGLPLIVLVAALIARPR